MSYTAFTKDLAALLQKMQEPNLSCCFWGGSEYLRFKAVSLLKQRYGAQFAIVEHELHQLDERKWGLASMQNDLFSPQKMGFFYTSKKLAWKILSKRENHPYEINVFVLAKKTDLKLPKDIFYLNPIPPKGPEIQNYLRRSLARAGIEVEPKLLSQFVADLGTEPEIMDSEVERWALLLRADPQKPVTLDHPTYERYKLVWSEAPFFGIKNSFYQQDWSKLKKEIGQLLDQGEAPLAIAGFLHKLLLTSKPGRLANGSKALRVFPALDLRLKRGGHLRSGLFKEGLLGLVEVLEQ